MEYPTRKVRLAGSQANRPPSQCHWISSGSPNGGMGRVMGAANAMMVPALTTVPNSAIPLTYRKRVSPAGDEKFSAAGILFVLPDGRGLFLKRGADCDHPGEWCLPGGRMEQDEDTHEAARRETLEETGHLPKWELAPIDRTTSHDGVDFTTFGQPLGTEFDPVLNDEHVEAKWAPLRDPPKPLHPGLAATLAKFLGAGDAIQTPDDGDTIDDAAVEEALAQAQGGSNLDAALTDDGDPALENLLNDFKMATGGREPNQQEDETLRMQAKGAVGDTAALVQDSTPLPLMLALDEASVRQIDDDGRMHVMVSNISKANVCPYRGKEIPGAEALGLEPERIYFMLRDPEELKKAAPTLNRVQLLREHTPIDADDHKPWDVVGAMGSSAEWVAPYVRNDFAIWSANDIADVQSGKKKELSAGYHYDPDMTSGEFNGIHYDGVMRNIRFNHVALVEEGRVGSDVVVQDSVDGLQWSAIEAALDALAAA
jgi:8-oxo-dGTP pyrophosphatase MutT (NUDIX family)